jgi:hypothetical protein
MFYKSQLYNTEKHPEMPSEYPWIVSDVQMDSDFIEITQEDYDILLASIDLTAYNTAIQYETNLAQQTEQREYGLQLIPILIDKMGGRNLTLAQNGATVNMIAIASDNSSVKLLIETGALKTARSICSQLQLKYPTHADIYIEVIDNITNFLTQKGYE